MIGFDSNNFNQIDDGVWCWFQDPRAIRYVGAYDKTYWGYVAQNGDINISSYDHKSQKIDTFTLHAALDVDDHAAPSILIRHDGRILVFYSKHNANTMYWRISVNSEDISAFGDELSFTGGGLQVCYPNPVQLAGEDNKIYLFYRKRTRESPTREREACRVSIDGGNQFGPEHDVIDVNNRTYVKVIANGIDKMHFCVTEGNGIANIHRNVSYCYYCNGHYYRADGEKISAPLPLKEHDLEKVYDSDFPGHYQAWIWDIALDSGGKPCIVFVTFMSDEDHRYNYARWTGDAWETHEISTAGGCLYAQESHYSGGICLDKEDPSTVYLSKFLSSQWEIQQWITLDGGVTWETPINITLSSTKKNVRPVAVRNHVSDLPVFWMWGDYASYTEYDTAIVAENLNLHGGMDMTREHEETLSFYKSLSITSVGIQKDKVSQKADVNMSDAELVAFYSERYVDIDVAEFLTRERRERLYGLCNLVCLGEFYLDVGCADGAHMDVLHRREIRGIGLDISVPNILRGRERYPHLTFVHGFAEALPFKDGYFDVVLLGDVLEHMRDPRLVLAECLRVAKIGLVLCVPIDAELTEEHIYPFTYEGVVELLTSFRLEASLYDFEGNCIGEMVEEAPAAKTYPWLIVRAEKTAETDAIVGQVMAAEGEVAHQRSVTELLRTDEWIQNTEHQRDETHRVRFSLLSHLIEGQEVLEVGCGNGDLTIEIARLGFDVVGVDLSSAGVAQAFDLAKRESLGERAQFSVMDATSLDFPDDSFDTVLIPEVLEHVRDSRRILEEAIRVVRNGGRIIVSVPDGLHVPFPGHIRVFFKDSLGVELGQYAGHIEWHKLGFKKWLTCSFFVKKAPGIRGGPLVDIIMPTYNGRKTIKDAIQTVLNQTYQNWNLVVVNDGGENVRDIVEGFSDERIRYIHSKHRGKSHTLNVGIEASNGEFIGYLDDDDVLYPMHLEVLVAAAECENRDLVHVDWYEVAIDERGHETGRVVEFRRDFPRWALINENHINHKCILHKRELLEKVGLYDEDLDILIDWDMIRRLAFVADLHHVWGITSEHRCYYNKGELQNRISSLWRRDPKRARRSLDKIVRKTNNLPAGTEDLKQAVICALQGGSYHHRIGMSELRTQLAEKEQAAQQLQARLAERDAQIDSLNQGMVERDGQIQALSTQVAEQEQAVKALTVQAGERDGQIVSLNQAVAERDGQIAAMLSSTSWRLTRPIRLLGDQLKRMRRWIRFSLRIVLFAPKHFDAQWYLKQNPDVAMSGMDPYKHFILFGKAEGRQSAPDVPMLHSNKSSVYHLLRSTPQIIAQKGGLWHTCAATLRVYRREGFAGVKNRIKQHAHSSDNRLTNGQVGIALDYVGKVTELFDTSRSPLRLIAFYLPQFHPIPENDEWWGKGFTEWTNVTKAVPQYVGHYQPRLPGELGFYDLRLIEVMHQQVELATLYGLGGFCFYYYWFGGRKLLERPLNQFLSEKSLNLPFCLCWANENWTRRWDGREQDVLMAQLHSPEGDVAFIEDVALAMKDSRYIRFNNRSILLVYRVSLLPNASATAERWRKRCRELGIGEIYLIAVRSFEITDPRPFGFDAALEFPPHQIYADQVNERVVLLNPEFAGNIYSYDDIVSGYMAQREKNYPLIKSVMTGWDNEARRPGAGHSFHGASPSAYAKWLRSACDQTADRSAKDANQPPFVFINAWNEWAEGAHLEPDRKYGYAYLHATGSIANDYCAPSNEAHRIITSSQKQFQKSSDTAVVIHLYHFDLFDEMAPFIKNARGCDLFFSVRKDISSARCERLISEFPAAWIGTFSNRGRDIYPFTEILRELRRHGYDYVCKVHSKKSVQRTDGRQLRLNALNSLLGSVGSVKAIRERFGRQLDLGILAPTGAIVNLAVPDRNVLNREWLDKLLPRLGLEHLVGNYNTSFVAGSMFWARMEAILALDELGLKASDFEEEVGQHDGTLAHAVERVLAASAVLKGFVVDEVQALLPTDTLEKGHLGRGMVSIENFRSLSDREWLDILIASTANPVVRGLRHPSFPERDVQAQFVGSSNADALREAYRFYDLFKEVSKAAGNGATLKTCV